MTFGYSWEDLHELSAFASRGQIIGALFIPEEVLDPGIRTVWMEEVEAMLQPNTAQKLWEAPWTLEIFFNALRHTQHHNLTQIVNHMVNWQDNIFLYPPEEADTWQMEPHGWTAQTFNEMALQWATASNVIEQAAQGAESLQVNPEATVSGALRILEPALREPATPRPGAPEQGDNRP